MILIEIMKMSQAELLLKCRIPIPEIKLHFYANVMFQ